MGGTKRYTQNDMRSNERAEPISTIYHAIALWLQRHYQTTPSGWVSVYQFWSIFHTGFDGGKNQTFTIRFKQKDGGQFQYVDSNTTTFTISNLSPGTEYDMTVRGKNSEGNGKFFPGIVTVVTDGMYVFLWCPCVAHVMYVWLACDVHVTYIRGSKPGYWVWYDGQGEEFRGQWDLSLKLLMVCMYSYDAHVLPMWCMYD